MLFDIDKLTSPTIYKLMSQTIIPRPIAWIVTKSKESLNIAPFSYFMALSSNPATCIVSIGHKKDGSPKDTLKNIREQKVCTICMVEPKDLEKMHFSSKDLEYNVSEAKEFNIETKEIFKEYPPMIKSAPVAFFCTFNQEINLGGKTVPVILNIKNIYVNDLIIKDKEKLLIEYKPLARVGKNYALIGEELKAPIIPD